MPTKSNAQGEDLVRRQRLDRFAVDAERARNEYAEMQEAVDERTARLRRERLKREAKEAATSGAAKRKGRSTTGSRGRATAEPGNPARSTTEAYRFRPGQRVRITSGLTGRAPAGGSYKILDQLPADQSGSKFYRIRSDVEQHDRVVSEAQLSRVKR